LYVSKDKRCDSNEMRYRKFWVLDGLTTVRKWKREARANEGKAIRMVGGANS